jgi:hypothetical protein
MGTTMALNTRRTLLMCVVACLTYPLVGAAKKGHGAAAGPPVLWRDPADIASRDLLNGPGGAKNQPHAPFEFVKEDLNGTSPKFVIRDADGVKWKLKLGEEVRPETAASRIVWAAGYFADEDYFLPDLVIGKMPSNLHRGEKFVEPDGLTHNARLKRYLEGEEKAGTWKWKDNPFTGTRELNGLRVMMALINNWDLKDVNNTIYEYEGTKIYLVSDLGASFGTTGRSVTRSESKGNLEAYVDSKFVAKVTPMVVDFNAPSRPAIIHVFEPSEFASRVNMEWIGKQIPIDDARWIGQILARLTPEQIQAAFGASGFSPKEVVGFSATLESRIAELNKL